MAQQFKDPAQALAEMTALAQERLRQMNATKPADAAPAWDAAATAIK